MPRHGAGADSEATAVAWHYLPFFFAAGFAALLVVFFETGFFAAAMGDLLSWIKVSSQGAA